MKSICQQCGKTFFTFPCRNAKYCSLKCVGKGNEGISRSEETRKKISKIKKIYYQTHKSWNKGISISEETRKKISCFRKLNQFKEKNSNWKGGKIKKDGYIYILNPEHPNANSDGYIPEHRLVVEKYLNKYLKPKEIVHHINKIRNDNRIKNLKLFNNKSEHQQYHHQLNKVKK